MVLVFTFNLAFNKVCHTKLLSKLDYYGIRGNTLLWINSFLSNRQQCVVVYGEKSSYLPVLSGSPKALRLDLLFRRRNCLVLDNQLARHDSCLQLQSDLNNPEVGEQDWLMSFNPEKCEILRVYRKKTHSCLTTLSMGCR